MPAGGVPSESEQRASDFGWAEQVVAAIRTLLRERVPGFCDKAKCDAEIVQSHQEVPRCERFRFDCSKPAFQRPRRHRGCVHCVPSRVGADRKLTHLQR